MIQRRSFLLSILAAGVAPAIARAGVLMPVKPRLVPRFQQGPQDMGRFIRMYGDEGSLWGDFECTVSGYDAYGVHMRERIGIKAGKVFSSPGFFKLRDAYDYQTARAA